MAVSHFCASLGRVSFLLRHCCVAKLISLISIFFVRRAAGENPPRQIDDMYEIPDNNGMKQQRGFTLIELVIYMGLMSIVVGLFAGILVTIVRIQTQQTSARQVAAELNFVLSTITRDVRDSVSFTVSTSTLTLTTSLASTTP